MNEADRALGTLITQLLHIPEREDRTGVGTHSTFAPPPVRFNCQNGAIPIVSRKRTWWKGVIVELLWFLRGQPQDAFLRKHNLDFWNDWTDPSGLVLQTYTKHMRDDFLYVLSELKRNPHSRRLLGCNWERPNPFPPSSSANLEPLPACHALWQVSVDADDTLHMQVYQRSADVFLGVPFNWASYGALLHILCLTSSYSPGTLTFVYGDLHLYANHGEAANTFLRTRPTDDSPHICFSDYAKEVLADPSTGISLLSPSDITLQGYRTQPSIEAPLNV